MTRDRGRSSDPGGYLGPSPSRVVDADESLIDRMATGDPSALSVLYERWVDRVHTLAFWILRDADEAEDVVEETFWQAWRFAARFDGRRAAGSTWLMVIARSRALDRLRSRRRMAGQLAAASLEEGLLEVLGPTSSERPDAHVEQVECSSGVAAALATLPPAQRDVILMAFFRGLSHTEIATHLALPLGTVKTRLRLGMEKLRELLAFQREERS